MIEAQLDVLNSFIGPATEEDQEGGIYYATILEYDKVDLGTKILYLERAITQDCQTFLQSLDNLYQDNLIGDEKDKRLEVIRSLKFINDVCFNNEVKYGNFGARAALIHYFGSLGTIEANDFKTTVEEIINNNIASIRKNNTDVDFLLQQQTRIAVENNTTPQIGWRLELDLPIEQLDPSQQQPSFQLSESRLHVFDPNMYPSIAECQTIFQPFINEGMIQQEEVIRYIVGYSSNYGPGTQVILNLKNEIIRNLVLNPNQIMEFSTAINLTSNQRALFEESNTYQFLIGHGKTLNEILLLDQRAINHITDRDVQALVTNEQLNLDQALKLHDFQKELLLDDEVMSFINVNGKTINDFLSINIGVLRNLTLPAIRNLVTNKTITFDRAINIDVTARKILKDKDAYQFLIDHGKTLDNILQITNACLCEKSLRGLVKNGTITFDQAMKVELHQLSILSDQASFEFALKNVKTVANILELNANQSKAIGSSYIRSLVNDGKLTFDRTMALDLDQIMFINLNSSLCQFMFDNGKTVNDIMDLMLEANKDKLLNLQLREVRNLVTNGEITFEQAINLDVAQRNHADNDNINELLATLQPAGPSPSM